MYNKHSDLEKDDTISRELQATDNVACDFSSNNSSYTDFTLLQKEENLSSTFNGTSVSIDGSDLNPDNIHKNSRSILIPELKATLHKFERSSSINHPRKEEYNSDKIINNELLMREVLSNIAVLAFVGPSGTGKSTRAIRVAKQNNISYIIDDGLLINGSKIVAGTSAKRAQTKMESVRQALFADSTRSAVMRKALLETRPPILMILGTSDSMLSKICNNLWLSQPSMLIRIEDVSTEEEIRQARNTRLTEGMHTIPVPSMEIKHEFSGYFSDPLNLIRQKFDKEKGLAPPINDTERTVVRPTFSTLGSYSISDEALLDLIKIIVKSIPGIYDVVNFKSEKTTYGVILSIGLAIIYGFNAQDVLLSSQQTIGKLIEEYTSITVVAINIKAQRLIN